MLNSLVLHRWQLSKSANQISNRLHQLLLAVFPEGESRCFSQLMKIIPYYPTPDDILHSNGLEKVGGLRQKDRCQILELAANSVGVPGDIYRQVIVDLNQQRIDVLAKLDAVTAMIKPQVRAHPCGDILLSSPFLGEIAAATIIGTIKDINRWPNKKKFKKALGVYNSLTQSGNSLSRTRQGKEGSRRGRRVLFQICLGCIRTNAHDNDFKDYYLRQVARGKLRIKALVSTMGKLAEIIYHCLKVGEL